METTNNLFSENNDNQPTENIPADVSAESPIALESDSQQTAEEKPLPKIHPNLHNSGRYKMFSNHSSANDIPKTSTGI